MKKNMDVTKLVKFIKGEETRVALFQNKIMRKIAELGCKFDVVPWMGDATAQVTYASTHSTKLPAHIKISSFLAKEDNMAGVYATLHEIGHAIDWNDCNRDFMTYNLTYGTGDYEIRAWEHAFKLGRELGFTASEFDDLHEYALKCLWTYFEGGICFSHHDRRFGFPRNKAKHWGDALDRMEQAIKKEKQVIRDRAKLMLGL
ncbi:hypothetical protein BpsS36_00058 [Bacillus phage vB_BpsS-36]|uniref:Uncharacterized protein n=1 Tax=Bacillus phage vB_BpsS-36 TaxID=2419622 RepID=A0A3G3BX37_9CAUD|nr:hypothetical protein BpsS36_00058 [Bacillus phage vB_BpsS-36]